jgi:putative transposase
VIGFVDKYSRYIVHQEVLPGTDGLSTSLAGQRAIETLPKGPDGRPLVAPGIRSDNGSGYISKEFRMVLTENGLTHRRIHPHCLEVNGMIERANRTLREGLQGEELSNYLELERVFARLRRRYSEERLHSALGFLLPGSSTEATPPRADSSSGESCGPRHGTDAGSGTSN